MLTGALWMLIEEDSPYQPSRYASDRLPTSCPTYVRRPSIIPRSMRDSSDRPLGAEPYHARAILSAQPPA